MRAPRAWWRGRMVAVVCGMIIFAGCAQPAEEPGLFGRRTADPQSPSGVGYDDAPPAAIDPELPVVGERTWVSGDEHALPFRIAVHGIRRIGDGAAVLDWSVTALSQVGLQPGRPVPDDVDLAAAGDPLAFRLVDVPSGKVYRPLVGNETGDCLCLRPDGPLLAGVTRIQQVAFGGLPDDLRQVAVVIPSVALFSSVPVADHGRVVRTIRPTELSRAPEVQEVVARSPEFEHPLAGGQRMRIGIVAVGATTDATSVVWTIETVEPGPGLDRTAGLPITAVADSGRGLSTASGLQVQVSAGDAAEALESPLTVWHAGSPGAEQGECLCTDLRGWAPAMGRAGRSVTVVSNLGPLPIYTQRVDVILPGLGTIERIEVVRPSTAGSQFAGFITDRSGTWSAAEPYHRSAARLGEWPTPVPDSQLLQHFRTKTLDLI